MIDPFFYVIAIAAIVVALVGSFTIWRADQARADEISQRKS